MTPGGPLLGGRLPHLLYGGGYNPDQWPEEGWAEDVRLVKESGVNLVSLGIFAWSRLEPVEGKYDFAWLDRVMDLLHKGGVSVDLATATASPPPWLSHKHPEMLPVTADGVRLYHGARQHYCPSSPVYRGAAKALVEALADRRRVQGLADGALWQRRGAQQGLGHRLLVAALLRLGGGVAASPHADLAQPK